MTEKPWIDLREAAPLFGMTFESAKNAILAGRFPCPIYRIGRRAVIDRDVLKEFFDKRKAEGLRAMQPKATRRGAGASK